MVKKGPKQTDAQFGGPTKPASGYFMYAGSVREGIMADLKTKAEAAGKKLALADIGRTIGEQWKTVSAEQKQEWNTKAGAEKAVYKGKMDEWEKTDNYKAYRKAKAAHVKSGKDKKAMEVLQAAGYPKRALSAYFQFGVDKTAEATAMARKELGLAEDAPIPVTKTTAFKKKLWDEASADVKKQYQDNYETKKAEYGKAKEDFEQNNEAYKTYLKAKNKAQKESDNMLGIKKSAMKKRQSAGGEPAGKRRKLDDSAEPDASTGAEESPIEASASSSGDAPEDEDMEEEAGEEEEEEAGEEEEEAGEEESPADE